MVLTRRFTAGSPDGEPVGAPAQRSPDGAERLRRGWDPLPRGCGSTRTLAA